MDVLNVCIYFVVSLVSMVLGFWCYLEYEYEEHTQSLRDLFFAWEVEDDLAREQRHNEMVKCMRDVRALWDAGKADAALLWSGVYAQRFPELLPMHLLIRRLYAGYVSNEKMAKQWEDAVNNARRLVANIVVTKRVPARDARGRFVSYRTARA